MTLVYSVDGMAGKGARAYEKRIASLLADKWSREYSSVAGFVKARMALAAVRYNTLLLRGSRTRYSWRPNGVDSFTAEAEGVLHEDWDGNPAGS